MAITTYRVFTPIQTAARDALDEMNFTAAFTPLENGFFTELRGTPVMAADGVDYSEVGLTFGLFAYGGLAAGPFDFQEFMSRLMQSVWVTGISIGVDANTSLALAIADGGLGAPTLPPMLWEFDITAD